MEERKGVSNYSVLKRQPHLSLTDIAYNVLLEAIINQDFQPGAPITIDSLARQLKMSNTPVREALMRVHGEGLVTQKANHGFVVSAILTANEMRQLFEVRHLLEVHALNVAALSAESVASIANLVKEMVTSSDGTIYGDYRDYLALDHRFHHELVALAGNAFLVGAWEDLHVHLHLSRLYRGVGLFDRNFSIEEHQSILDALQQGNNTAAAQLLSQHIRRVGKSMQSFLRK